MPERRWATHRMKRTPAAAANLRGPEQYAAAQTVTATAVNHSARVMLAGRICAVSPDCGCAQVMLAIPSVSAHHNKNHEPSFHCARPKPSRPASAEHAAKSPPHQAVSARPPHAAAVAGSGAESASSASTTAALTSTTVVADRSREIANGGAGNARYALMQRMLCVTEELHEVISSRPVRLR